jgi:hypothetical protein
MQSFISRLFPGNAAMTASFQPVLQNVDRQGRLLYWIMDAYYQGNAVYDRLRRTEASGDNLVALRNPVQRVVESYATHVWPGTLPDALPIEALNERIIEPIQQLWTWSNWGARKQVAIRWLALYGDLFIKVIQTEDRQRVFFQLIRPHFVTEMQRDERGVLEYIRVDVPQAIRQGDRIVQMTHTEVWTGESYRLWVHDRHSEHDQVKLEDLGAPQVTNALTDFGIDFIPIVHVPFRDTGDVRGTAAVTHALDKIDESNRVATRLHETLFRHNKPTWVVGANSADKDGRPMSAPRFAGADGKVTGTVSAEMPDIVYLNGMASLDSLIPNINYAAALDILNAMLTDLEADLPELAFYRLRELSRTGTLSGRAVRLLLSDAVSRILEARGNAEAGLARADMMALTIGANAGLFPNIGAYDNGDFDHTFKDRPVIPLSDIEEAEGVAALDGIVSVQEQLRLLSYTPEQIDQIMAERKAEQPPPPIPALPTAAPTPQAIARSNNVASS